MTRMLVERGWIQRVPSATVGGASRREVTNGIGQLVELLLGQPERFGVVAQDAFSGALDAAFELGGALAGFKVADSCV